MMSQGKERVECQVQTEQSVVGPALDAIHAATPGQMKGNGNDLS